MLPIRTVALVLLGLAAVGCAPASTAALSPEAAMQACEAPTALALRAQDDGFQSVVLDPAATSRIERRSASVGSQPVGMVVAGRGTARLAAGTSDLRYLCLIDPRGAALFVDVETADGARVLAECATS